MSRVIDIVTEADVQSLWGAGFTIVRRQIDPFYVDEKIIPAGMAYQWCEKRPNDGWNPVLASRHDGLYAPAGYKDIIEIGGLMLCERPKVEVDVLLKESAEKAQQNVDDWATKNASIGLTGAARVGYSDDASEIIGEREDDANQTHIPAELFPYLSEVYAVRDQLLDMSGSSDHSVSAKTAALMAAITTVSERRKDDINVKNSAVG